VDRSTASYQALAHGPSVARLPAGQASMAGSNEMLSASHSAARTPRGSSSTSRASITGGADPRRSAVEVEELAPGDRNQGHRASPRRAGRNRRQEPPRGRGSGRHSRSPPSTWSRSRRSCGASSAWRRGSTAAGPDLESPRRHPPPVRGPRGESLGAQRMIGARGREIDAVEGLVDHGAVGAVLERAHHRRRDVARPRPQAITRVRSCKRQMGVARRRLSAPS
jgi:hypothetical protein